MIIIGYIYSIENNINHKKYIGQTINPQQRWKSHKNDDMKNPNLVIGRAFIKYGIENFTFNIIEECDNDKMSEREKFWIKEFNTCVKDENSWGYNMTHGGESLFGEDNPFYGKQHTEEFKSKMSELAKQRTKENNPFYGKHHSEETKEKIKQANTGRQYTEEQKLKMNRSEKQSGENNPFYGKKHTEETKKKISECNKNKIPYNATKWIAWSDNQQNALFFESIGLIMKWLINNNYIKQNEHFTMSMLKNNLKKSELKHIKFMGYYWRKSVETIENTELKHQEVSRVDSEIDAESKCEDMAV